MARTQTIFLLAAALGLALASAPPHAAGVVQAPAPGHIVSANGGGIIGYNNDGSNRINYSAEGYAATAPSVSRDNKLIAFQSTRDDRNGNHIYVMNGDGTGTRQLTFPGSLPTGNGNSDSFNDVSPAISPDGTKIAFVARRDEYTLPSGYIATFYNVWVINTDGTNLHQVTQTQPNVYGNGVFGSDIASVVWGPDNHTLAFRGLRLIGTSYHFVVGTVQDDGSGYGILDYYDSTGESASLDWSPNGRYLAYVLGNEAQGAPPTRLRLFDLTARTIVEIFQSDQNGNTVVPESGGAGALRFSPDSTRIMSHDGYGVASYIYNLDGSNVVKVNFDSGRGEALWWASGAAIPLPDHLAVTPNPIYVAVGGTVHLTPTLYDAQNNIIVHAVRAWNLNDSRFFSVSVLGDLTGGAPTPYGPLGVTPDNGGVTAPIDYVIIGTPQLLYSIDPNGNLTSRSNGQIYISVIVQNTGTGAATYMRLASVTLNGIPATSGTSFYNGAPVGPLPFTIDPGGFGPGGSKEFQVVFPASAGASGARAVLRLGGDYVVGTFSSSLRVTLP